jgi:hypothetical protein
MDQIVILRDRNREKLHLFRDNLANQSPAQTWLSGIPKELTRHWEVIRASFMAKRVDKLDAHRMRKKVGDLVRGLDPLRSGTAALNIF